MQHVNVSLILLLTVIKIYAEPDGELLAVSLIHRHGDRTPTSFYPTDPHKNSPNWPAPPGELTNVGKRQLYELGKWIRNRYDGFLSPIYNRSEINVRSSNIDRCLMSAALNLAGLYPPQGEDIWKENLAWQPIPIHTLPTEDDDIAGIFSSCPKYSKLLQEAQRLPYFKDIQDKNEVLYEYLTNKTGMTISNIINLFSFFDTLQIEVEYNFTLPKWALQEYDNLKNIHDGAPILLTYTPELTKLFVGRLYQKISAQFDEFSGGNSTNSKKFMVYSLHDDQIYSLLNALKVPNLKPVPYAALIMFEMRKSPNGEFFVQIFYKTNSSLSEPIKIQDCEMKCSLGKFFDILKPISLTKEEFKKQCNEL